MHKIYGHTFFSPVFIFQEREKRRDWNYKFNITNEQTEGVTSFSINFNILKAVVNALSDCQFNVLSHYLGRGNKNESRDSRHSGANFLLSPTSNYTRTFQMQVISIRLEVCCCFYEIFSCRQNDKHIYDAYGSYWHSMETIQNGILPLGECNSPNDWNSNENAHSRRQHKHLIADVVFNVISCTKRDEKKTF